MSMSMAAGRHRSDELKLSSMAGSKRDVVEVEAISPKGSGDTNFLGDLVAFLGKRARPTLDLNEL